MGRGWYEFPSRTAPQAKGRVASSRRTGRGTGHTEGADASRATRPQLPDRTTYNLANARSKTAGRGPLMSLPPLGKC